MASASRKQPSASSTAPSQPVGPAQSPERLARLEEDLRVVVGLAGEVAVELQRVLQQGALDRLDLGDVLEPLFADARQHAVDGLAGLAEVGHGLEAARLGAVALVLEADVGQADHDRQGEGGDGAGTRQRRRWPDGAAPT